MVSSKNQLEGFKTLIASQKSESSQLEDIDGDFRHWNELSTEGKVSWIASDAAYYDLPFEPFAEAVREILGELHAAAREEAALRLAFRGQQELCALEKLLPKYDRLEPAPPLVERFREMLNQPVASNCQEQATSRELVNALESIIPYAEMGAEDLDARVDSKNTELTAGDAWHAIGQARDAIAKAMAKVSDHKAQVVARPGPQPGTHPAKTQGPIDAKPELKSYVVQVEETWRFTQQVVIGAISREDAEYQAQEEFAEQAINWHNGTCIDRDATALTENGVPVRRSEHAFDKHPTNPHQNKVGSAPSQSAQEPEQHEQDHEINR
jgi:hypothetical protein